MLRIIRDSEGGVLIHCVSGTLHLFRMAVGLFIFSFLGWDRTPFFVSLIRIFQWADEESHASLTPEEILYLTLAYDWLLFR